MSGQLPYGWCVAARGTGGRPAAGGIAPRPRRLLDRQRVAGPSRPAARRRSLVPPVLYDSIPPAHRAVQGPSRDRGGQALGWLATDPSRWQRRHLAATSATMLPILAVAALASGAMLPATSTFVQEGPCIERTAGGFGYAVGGAFPEGTDVPSMLGNKRRPRPASRARAVRSRGFVAGVRMRSWLSSRSDAGAQAACPGPSPATPPWSLVPNIAFIYPSLNS
jgi:hypothetical protein